MKNELEITSCELVHRALLNKKKGTEKEKDQKGNPPNHHTVHGLDYVYTVVFLLLIRTLIVTDTASVYTTTAETQPKTMI